jgi:hypothetical protein
MLTKDDILAANDIPSSEILVPEWGGKVYIKTMNGAEREQFERAFEESKQRLTVRATLAVFTVCDDKGEPLFTIADVDRLTKKSSRALDRIFDVARKLNGLGDREVAELEKN